MSKSKQKQMHIPNYVQMLINIARRYGYSESELRMMTLDKFGKRIEIIEPEEAYQIRDEMNWETSFLDWPR